MAQTQTFVRSTSSPLHCGELPTFTTTAKARVGTSQSSLKQLDFNPKAGGKENLDQLLPPIPSHVRDFIVHAEIGYAASSRYPRSASASLPDTHGQIRSHPERAQKRGTGSIEAAPSRKGLISFSQPSLHSSFRCPASFQQPNRDRSHTPQPSRGARVENSSPRARHRLPAEL